MKIIFVRPRLELQPYIETFWVFESANGFPDTNSNVVVPNGCSKLIIPYDNSIISSAFGNVQVSRERRLYFVGNRDSSTLLKSSSRRTGFITIEFCPHGAFPIFGIPMSKTFNGLWDGDDLFAKWGYDVREALSNLECVDQKVTFIQDELVALLRKNACRNQVVEYCINALRSTDGRRDPATRATNWLLPALFGSTLQAARGLVTESPCWRLSLSKVLPQVGRGPILRRAEERPIRRLLRPIAFHQRVQKNDGLCAAKIHP